jgi:hypothetical protein
MNYFKLAWGQKNEAIMGAFTLLKATLAQFTAKI